LESTESEIQQITTIHGILKSPFSSQTDEEQPGTQEPTQDDDAISQDLLQQTRSFEEIADGVLKEIETNEAKESREKENLELYIRTEITNRTSQLEEQISTKLNLLEDRIQESTRLNNTLQAKIKTFDTLETTGRKYNEKINGRLCYFNNKFNEIETKVNNTIKRCEEHLNETNTAIEAELDDLNNRIQDKFTKMETRWKNFMTHHSEQNKQATTIEELVNITKLTEELRVIYQQHKARITRLNDKTMTMMETFATNSTNAVKEFKKSSRKLHTRLSRKNAKTYQTRKSARKIRFSSSSDDDSDSSDSVTTNGENDSDSTLSSWDKDLKGSTKKKPPSTPKTLAKTYQPIPNTEYLRKNVKIACTEENRVLEFYIKLRIAIAKGGIYIIPVEEITIDHSIRQKIKGLRRHDYITQSNALYTLLSNKSIVSTDFTMGQNCILSNSTTMDGFSALKAMLKRTHPTLTKRRPPAEAPKLDNYDNLHMYKQGMRNHYLLHELFNGNTYSPLEKAKEFIRGIRDTTYDNAVKRI
jgi:hypothetical protein